MDCGTLRGLVALHAGGETTGAERIAVEAHLSACADCAREFEGYRSARGRLAELREGVAPAGAIEGIWARLEPQVARKPVVRMPRLEWALRAAAVLVIGVAVGYLFTTGSRSAGRDSLPGGSPLVDYRHDGRSSTEIGTNAPPGAAIQDFTKSIRPFERVITVDGPHYLPRVGKIVASDERSF